MTGLGIPESLGAMLITSLVPVTAKPNALMRTKPALGGHQPELQVRRVTAGVTRAKLKIVRSAQPKADTIPMP